MMYLTERALDRLRQYSTVQYSGTGVMKEWPKGEAHSVFGVRPGLIFVLSV